jgi:acyl-CoA thioester hydrolase
VSSGPAFDAYAVRVLDEWIDYNGHLTDSAYAIILSDANEDFLLSLGLSEGYRERTGRSMYTAECHITYRAEVGRELVRASSRLVELRSKGIRVQTTLTREDGVEAAFGEHVYVHVDGETGRPCEFDEALRALLIATLSDDGS